MSDQYLQKEPSTRHGMFVCVLCNTGNMNRKNANSHLRGLTHRLAVNREQFNARLKQRAVHANKKMDCPLFGCIRPKMDTLGLPRWRHHIKAELCDYILIDNRGDVDDVPPSIERLLQRYTKYEKTSLLELAVWKASCLWFDESQTFPTMQDISDQWAMDENFDPNAYKKKRRFAGNVAVIMRGVVEYLE